MTLAPIPVLDLLTPEPLSVPPDDRYTRITQSIQTGLPYRVGAGPGIALALIAPTGVATAWADADPRTVLSTSDNELEPFDPTTLATAATAPVDRIPLRLILLHDGAPAAAIPLRRGRLSLAPDAGADDLGTVIELVVLAWELHAGTLRGAGDVGSSIDLAWRRVDRGTDSFSPPAPNPHVVERAGPWGFYGAAMGHAGDMDA
jgi:hypothetical protein